MTAELVYYSDDKPGIRRIRRGRGFSYTSPDGTSISDTSERKRLEALAVPPAYEDVWMCPLHNGHLQATGRDARARKQYRYHEEWSEAQAKTKFEGLVNFANSLPRLRAQVSRDLKEDAGAREFALACAVTLIDRTSLRVGNPEYTTQNGSHGALTLRHKHISLEEGGIRLRYTAKGGKKVRKLVKDKTLCRALNKIDDLPGAQILSWLDADEEVHALTSQALNCYIASSAGGEGFTAKTFRTWAGSVAAFEVAEKGGATIKEIAQAAADRLSNTPTVARNSYIHPEIIALAGVDDPKQFDAGRSGLRAAENRLLGFLER
ncbi:DNA topoisomerase IB [Sulfitobacter guttiformis]|uniref:DNA topoisomerase n=1 Tax=Sulfitobacter guttiformis TaxID=74349 RepID=A0A420DU20_9RHOB|nr:DNA topoisomerase IB [Sulfitobacter guttiformis]KIN71202.1 DNA topoisomerase [Sulfitobacter guttiformis KCTC 32187]RKE97673.1 DNA topoisomerase-1 [Sulfitobacter guttiformis]